jgi:hypothetical protein
LAKADPSIIRDPLLGAKVEDIWTYPTRELTQAKFPFWSAIIAQTFGISSVAASSAVAVAVQPPSGETWLIFADLWLECGVAGSKAFYSDSGDISYLHQNFYTGGSYGDIQPHIGVIKILTNTRYGHLRAYNADSANARNFRYGYSGFKLSKPLWSPKRLNDPEPKPWKKPTSLILPSAIAPLQKYAFDILGIDPSKPNEYGLGVILEEDTPLAIDPVTNFPVERLTAVVKADVLADFIGKFKAKTADPIQTGYRKYLDKWKLEGIDFGV